MARVLSDSAGLTRPFRVRTETAEARNGVVKRRPHRPPSNGGAREPHWSGCPIDSRDWAEVGRTHLWFVDLAASQGGVGPPADLVTKALTRRATRSRTGIARCRSSVRREADRVRRGGVANGCASRESVVSKPHSLGSGERASARRTTRRNASRPCSMAPNPRHRVGARFSQVGLAVVIRGPPKGPTKSAQAGPRRRKLPLGIGPEEAVPARSTRDVRGRTRPSEAPPATCAGGQHRSHKLHRRERSCTTLHGTVPR